MVKVAVDRGLNTIILKHLMKSRMPLKKLPATCEPIVYAQTCRSDAGWQQRVGFTLIELLLVVSIIAAMAGLVIGIQTGIQHKQNVAKAKAEVQALALALEGFKAKYGDYPWIQFEPDGQGSAIVRAKQDTARLLYKALTGEAKLVPIRGSTGGTVSAVHTYPLSRIPAGSGVSEQPGPVLLDPNKMTVFDGQYFADEPNFNAEEAYFVDPWNNAYEYFYIQDGVRPNPNDEFAHWKSKTFVLLSLGKDGVHDVSSTALVEMLTDGVVISNPADYFEAGSAAERKNADNIIHGMEY